MLAAWHSYPLDSILINIVANGPPGPRLTIASQWNTLRTHAMTAMRRCAPGQLLIKRSAQT